MDAASLQSGFPGVRNYLNYRVYLQDYYRFRKERQASWSYATWASQLGLKSKSAVAMILTGRRHPSYKLTCALSAYFQLSGEDAEYFADLVQLEKSGNGSNVSFLLMQRLAKKRESQTFERLDLDTFSVISQWYYTALKEMVNLEGFRFSPNWISHQLYGRISSREARTAIQKLVQLGILEKDSEGRLCARQVHLRTANDVADEGLKRFHEQMLDLARSSIRQEAVAEREVLGTTFAIREQDVPKAKKLLRELTHELTESVESPRGDRVYQLQIGFFPLTRKRSKKS